MWVRGSSLANWGNFKDWYKQKGSGNSVRLKIRHTHGKESEDLMVQYINWEGESSGENVTYSRILIVCIRGFEIRGSYRHIIKKMHSMKSSFSKIKAGKAVCPQNQTYYQF